MGSHSFTCHAHTKHTILYYQAAGCWGIAAFPVGLFNPEYCRNTTQVG